MTVRKPHKSLRVRYSMRILLLTTGIVGASIGYLVRQAHLQREARLTLDARGGWTVDAPVLGEGRELPSAIVAALGPDYCHRIRDVLALMGTLKDDDLAILARLPGLRSVTTNHAWMGSTRGMFALTNSGSGYGPQPITDRGLEYLSRARSLETLVLFNTEVTDEGLAALASLRDLKILKISSPRITDAAVPQLAKLQSLERFWIAGTSISSQGASELQQALPVCDVVTKVVQ